MKHLRKFDSVSEMNTVFASATIDILGLAYDTQGNPVLGVVTPRKTPFYIDVRGAVTLAATPNLQMSTDGETWTDTTATTLSSGKTYFRVASDQESPLQPNWTEDENSDYDIGGNINSLVKTNFENDTTCYSFYKSSTGFFQGKAELKSAGKLILPATTLVQTCYGKMFRDCSSLTQIPTLPATTLATGCYGGMFMGCTSLTTTPTLPATTLANQCYQSMFQSCTALTTAPVLPATTLAQVCYANMFAYCSSLTTAPVLPATTLAESCYQGMFGYCSSLTTAPVLPATTLVKNCYNSMFVGCVSLTTTPALPAETMAFACYKWMFEECTNLVNVPVVLPATTLAENCYGGMFSDCASLTTAPVLPATTLAAGCYQQLFQNSSNINYIKCLATDKSASNCTTNWTDGVAATGTFVKNPNMSESTWGTGNNGIPSGWTVQDATE